MENFLVQYMNTRSRTYLNSLTYMYMYKVLTKLVLVHVHVHVGGGQPNQHSGFFNHHSSNFTTTYIVNNNTKFLHLLFMEFDCHLLNAIPLNPSWVVPCMCMYMYT